MIAPTLFPRQGQIWEASADCDVQIHYLFNAPITFDGTARLAAGERVCVSSEAAGPQPAAVGFLPVRYAELQDRLVPADLRDTPRYKAYLLSAESGYFREHFRLVG
jgi:hypothetical protein